MEKMETGRSKQDPEEKEKPNHTDGRQETRSYEVGGRLMNLRTLGGSMLNQKRPAGDLGEKKQHSGELEWKDASNPGIGRGISAADR